MKFNLNAFLPNLDGSPSDVPLWRICFDALTSDDPMVNRGVPAERKIERVKLGLQVHEPKEPVDLTPEQLTEIKSMVNATQTARIVYVTYPLLDGGALVAADAQP